MEKDTQKKGAFIFVESNTTGTGHIFLKDAMELGLFPVFLTKRKENYSFIPMEGVLVIEVDTSDEGAIIEKIDQIEDIRGVYSSSEYYIEVSARVARALGLWHVSPEAVANCRDKFKQGQILKQAGISVPETKLIKTMEELEKQSRNISLPVVVKPIGGSGSVNVVLCNTPEEVFKKGREILAVKENERGVFDSGGLLIQAYEEGIEFSVEILNGKVFGITKKSLSQLPWFVETGHDFPAKLSEIEEGLIQEYAIKAISALNLSTGPVHLELRMGGKGPVIIEVNPRLAGGYIPMVVKYATGKSLIRAAILTACGRALPEKFYDNRQNKNYVSIRFIMKTREGAVGKTMMTPQIGEELERMDHIEEVDIYSSRMGNTQVFHDYRDRLGHVIAVSNQQEEAEKACIRAVWRVGGHE